MGIFIEMLDSFSNLYADLDDGDNLTKFFGMLKHFNNEVDINLNLKKKIEEHFDYKWKNDKNQAYDDEAELAIME